MSAQISQESPFQPSAKAATPTPTRRVVDTPKRMFHWLFVLWAPTSPPTASAGGCCTSRWATPWQACSAFACSTACSAQNTPA
jgi:hypothetical protein